MKIIGYGEDSLTYWAITNQMPEIQNQLDITDETIDVVFYRPSFGRKGCAEQNEKPRVGPEFGEFDAIICSTNHTCLIEAKWTKSSEIQNGVIKLGQPQKFRHKIMRAIMDQWNCMPDGKKDWCDFIKRLNNKIETNELIIDLAPDGSRLARNMQHILEHTCSKPRTVLDVILFLRLEYDKQPKPGSRESFSVVDIKCPAGISGFVEM